MTPHGKLDRKALPEPPPARGAGTSPAPRDRLELELLRIWEEVLGRGPLGVRDEFFEHGGHSLAAVRLLARVEAELGRGVLLAAFFQEPTVERMAALLRREGTPRPASPLVTIRPGGPAAALFCVHPVGGTVQCYRELARHLRAGHPVYALEAPGLDGGAAPARRVEDLASRYLEAIRARQERGPYRLVGWSFGGLVVFEMARRLGERGAEAWPVLLDSRAPGSAGSAAAAPEADGDGVVLRVLARGLAELTGCELAPAREALARIDGRAERMRYFLDQARRADSLPPGVGLDQLRPVVAVLEAHHRAAAAYAPEPFAGRLAVIRARDPSPGGPPGAAGPPEPALGWDRLARGGLFLDAAPGTHETLLSPPHAASVAERVERALAWFAGGDGR